MKLNCTGYVPLRVFLAGYLNSLSILYLCIGGQKTHSAIYLSHYLICWPDKFSLPLSTFVSPTINLSINFSLVTVLPHPLRTTRCHDRLPLRRCAAFLAVVPSAAALPDDPLSFLWSCHGSLFWPWHGSAQATSAMGCPPCWRLDLAWLSTPNIGLVGCPWLPSRHSGKRSTCANCSPLALRQHPLLQNGANNPNPTTNSPHISDPSPPRDCFVWVCRWHDGKRRKKGDDEGSIWRTTGGVNSPF